MAIPVLRRSHLRRNHLRHSDAAEQRDRSTPQRNPASARSRWTEFAELYEQMDRLLSERFGQTVGDRERSGVGWRPAADVEETADAYRVELELPGMQREDVSVEFGGGELVVTGQVKERERVGFLRTRTRPVGRFDYRVSLPAEVEDDQVTASLADGVLAVQVPKTEKARQRKIPISTS
jgi:HSP20 family protein